MCNVHLQHLQNMDSERGIQEVVYCVSTVMNLSQLLPDMHLKLDLLRVEMVDLVDRKLEEHLKLYAMVGLLSR